MARKILQIKEQVNLHHLVVIFQDGAQVKEIDLDLKIQDLKKESEKIAETEKYILGDQDAKPDIDLINDSDHSYAFFGNEYDTKDQERYKKEFLLFYKKRRKDNKNLICRIRSVKRRYILVKEDKYSKEILALLDEIYPDSYWPDRSEINTQQDIKSSSKSEITVSNTVSNEGDKK
jgi:hypothetical protein